MLKIPRKLATETDQESAGLTPDSRRGSRESSLELLIPTPKGDRKGIGRDAETTTGLERALEAETLRDHKNKERLLKKAPRHQRKSSTGSHVSHLATLQSKVQVVRNITIVS